MNGMGTHGLVKLVNLSYRPCKVVLDGSVTC
jgi:hypothetical protein